MRCRCGYLSGARCRLFAYSPANATAVPKPHLLLPYVNPDCFSLSGTGLPRLSWKRGRSTSVVVVVIVVVVLVVVDVDLKHFCMLCSFLHMPQMRQVDRAYSDEESLVMVCLTMFKYRFLFYLILHFI